MDFIIQVALVLGVAILIFFLSYVSSVKSKKNSNDK